MTAVYREDQDFAKNLNHRFRIAISRVDLYLRLGNPKMRRDEPCQESCAHLSPHLSSCISISSLESRQGWNINYSLSTPPCWYSSISSSGSSSPVEMHCLCCRYSKFQFICERRAPMSYTDWTFQSNTLVRVNMSVMAHISYFRFSDDREPS